MPTFGHSDYYYHISLYTLLISCYDNHVYSEQTTDVKTRRTSIYGERCAQFNSICFSSVCFFYSDTYTWRRKISPGKTVGDA